MKKYEKILIAVFGAFCAVFLVDILPRLAEHGVRNERIVFNTFTRILSVPFAVSFLGIIAVLVCARLRCRKEAGLTPISKLYKASFRVSFVPFVLLLIYSFASAFTGTDFLFDTCYGFDAFWLNFVLVGVLMLSYIIPVFPVLIFWQILYLVNRFRYRERKVK